MAKLSEYEYAFYIDDQLVMITNVDEIGELMLDGERPEFCVNGQM